MPDRQKRKGQALMIELQHSAQQGITVWLGDDGGYPEMENAALQVGEDISYGKNGACSFGTENRRPSNG